MTKSNDALVVTSINPHSNISYQLRCFRRWQEAGFVAWTANVEKEAELLKGHGLSDQDIKIIAPRDTGEQLFGKPVPRIKPLLLLLQETTSFHHFTLTNADIFPAIRSKSITRFWERCCNSGLGMTREESHALEAYSYLSDAPYRGGLDTFYMTREALDRVNKMFARCSSSERMAFGIPGWDYLLGACLLSPDVGGAIMDSGALLHRTHRPSYGDVDEFGYYIGDMRALGAVATDSPDEAAHEFSRRIDAECTKNRRLSDAVKTIYFKPKLHADCAPHDTSGLDCVVAALGKIAPSTMQGYRRSALTSLASRLIEEEDATLAMALSYLVNSPSRLQRYAETLVAIAFTVRCRQLRGALVPKHRYPRGNQHAAVIRQVLQDTEEESPLRRLRILEVFGAELVDHGIFNPRLYDYLVLCSENDQERALLVDIQNSLWSQEHAA